MIKRIRRTITVVMILLLILGCISCVTEKAKICVTWLDSDGSVIANEIVVENYDPTSRELPKDSNEWHYTGWQQTQSGDVVVCTAVRKAKNSFVWKDYDGSILKEAYVIDDEGVLEFDLPQNTDKWKYTEWKQTGTGKNYVYEAKRTPNLDYFIGNVFQIILKDQKGEVLGSGSGFVINEEGWFVTNNHVMDKGNSAVAFFDIKDNEGGQQYTQLDILGGVYNNVEKDIFVGKLDGYQKIKNHYVSIPFTEEYAEGDVSYSVGYPNSSTRLQVNEGVILEEYSDIYNKIDGVYYVLSDSYIAPGSSGGILVNSDFEVIGITSMGFYADANKNHYTSGGSIPYFLFKNALTHLSDSKIVPLYEIYNIK